jgi:hypothetical protein
LCFFLFLFVVAVGVLPDLDNQGWLVTVRMMAKLGVGVINCSQVKKCF